MANLDASTAAPRDQQALLGLFSGLLAASARRGRLGESKRNQAVSKSCGVTKTHPRHRHARPQRRASATAAAAITAAATASRCQVSGGDCRCSVAVSQAAASAGTRAAPSSFPAPPSPANPSGGPVAASAAAPAGAALQSGGRAVPAPVTTKPAQYRGEANRPSPPPATSAHGPPQTASAQVPRRPGVGGPQAPQGRGASMQGAAVGWAAEEGEHGEAEGVGDGGALRVVQGDVLVEGLLCRPALVQCGLASESGGRQGRQPATCQPLGQAGAPLCGAGGVPAELRSRLTLNGAAASSAGGTLLSRPECWWHAPVTARIPGTGERPPVTVHTEHRRLGNPQRPPDPFLLCAERDPLRLPTLCDPPISLSHHSSPRPCMSRLVLSSPTARSDTAAVPAPAVRKARARLTTLSRAFPPPSPPPAPSRTRSTPPSRPPPAARPPERLPSTAALQPPSSPSLPPSPPPPPSPALSLSPFLTLSFFSLRGSLLSPFGDDPDGWIRGRERETETDRDNERVTDRERKTSANCARHPRGAARPDSPRDVLVTRHVTCT
jgi:hypothetical protein